MFLCHRNDWLPPIPDAWCTFGRKNFFHCMWTTVYFCNELSLWISPKYIERNGCHASGEISTHRHSGLSKWYPCKNKAVAALRAQISETENKWHAFVLRQVSTSSNQEHTQLQKMKMFRAVQVLRAKAQLAKTDNANERGPKDEKSARTTEVCNFDFTLCSGGACTGHS